MAPEYQKLPVFAEYQLFEPADEQGMIDRQQQNRLFQAGKQANPIFDYPKLDKEALHDRRADYDQALQTTPEQAEASDIAKRRAGVDIALASLGLQVATTHTERWTSGRQITDKSIERYGDLHPEYFWPVVLKSRQMVEAFEPGNVFAEMTKQRVLHELPVIPEGTESMSLVNEELIDGIREEVMRYLVPVISHIPEEGTFSVVQAATLTQQSLANVGLEAEDWTAKISETATIFSVRNSKKQVIVPGSAAADGAPRTFSAQQLKRLLAHEVGIHAMRRDKSLGADFEEGMGILVESVVTNQANGTAIKRAEDRYLHVGLATGADGVLRNARQVFEITWRLEAMRRAENGIISPAIEAEAKQAVQSHIDNIFRGTDHQLPGVVYARAKIYLEGLAEACAYARERADDAGWLAKLVQKGRA